MLQALEATNQKWRGSVSGIVNAPLDKVWPVVSQTKRLSEWMPMVERCTNLAGEEGIAGYVRLVSGFMFPQPDGERSWIKEMLLSMDPFSHLIDYGDDSTLVQWSFEINPVEGTSEENIIDYLGFLYKSCINKNGGAIEAASKRSV
ncbi:hypothetical protein ACJRO7_029071 [Eucalyptus globulus]|uniref:Uncharacterized protein n=1 Tax=Eucalyptus globulus TaxID=34317 RepID=A0ABD3JZC4_EUCGL